MRILAAVLIIFGLSFSPCHAADVQDLINEGMGAYKAGDFKQSGALLRQAGDELFKAKNPQAAAIWGNAAIALMRAGDYAEAAELYERILVQKNPPKEKLQQYYKNLVECRKQLKQPALRAAAIEKMIKALPKMDAAQRAEVLAQQGDTYRALELYRPAADAYGKALKALPKDSDEEKRARLLGALGQSQKYAGDYAAAGKTLAEARALAEKLGVDLTIAEAISNLGILNLEQGDYPKAIEYFKAALDIERKASLRLNEGSDLNNMAMAQRGAGFYPAAMALLNDAITAAKETGNLKGEGFATMNRGRGYRISGQLDEARADYNTAMELFAKAGVKEGQGAALLGAGRLDEFEGKPSEALAKYEKALALFESVDMPRWEAAALLCLGGLYQKASQPKRKTRDLVFDEEDDDGGADQGKAGPAAPAARAGQSAPAAPAMPSGAESLAKAKECFTKALKLAEMIGSREMIWEAQQGLGYADFREGKLDSALALYQSAINGISKMRVTVEDALNSGDFLAGREDLYGGAIQVCSALYDRTKEKKYLDLITRYNETLQNEIRKASAATANLKYQDPAKQRSFELAKALAVKRDMAHKAIPVVKELPEGAGAEEKRQHELAAMARKEQELIAAKADKEAEKAVAEFRKNYPNDAHLFDANLDSRVNLDSIQKTLKADQAALLYTSLPDKLLITAVTRDGISHYSGDVGKNELKKAIIDDFVIGYIHKGFKINHANNDPGGQKTYYDKSTRILKKLHAILIAPAAKDLEGKTRLYVVNDGFLSQIPFSMLVSGDKGSRPEYLIEKYEIANLRPSIVEKAMASKKTNGKIKRMLAVANPENKNFNMGFLEGTVKEVSSANINLDNGDSENKDIALTPRYDDEKNPVVENELQTKLFPRFKHITDTAPTEKWLYEKLGIGKEGASVAKGKQPENGYEIMYFATHGQAQSDTYTKLADLAKRAESKEKARMTLESSDVQSMIRMRDERLNTKTPLNGFLYLSSDPKQPPIVDKEGKRTDYMPPPEEDGLLTIGEIMGMPDNIFKDTRYVLLSACNAAVTYVPYALAAEEGAEVATIEESTYLDPAVVEKDLSALGMRPDLDQATFVESFMRHGVNNVYASYWQLDDEAGGIIMSKFWEEIGKRADNPDMVAALAEAQRDYLRKTDNNEITRMDDAKGRKKVPANPAQPYYWAPGGMFGI